MVEHANGGSLWQWLGMTTRNAAPSQSRIGQLMILAAEFASTQGPLANPGTTLTLANMNTRLPETGDLDYQDLVTRKYLDAMASLRRRNLPQEHMSKKLNGGCSLYTGWRCPCG